MEISWNFSVRDCSEVVAALSYRPRLHVHELPNPAMQVGLPDAREDHLEAITSVTLLLSMLG